MGHAGGAGVGQAPDHGPAEQHGAGAQRQALSTSVPRRMPPSTSTGSAPPHGRRRCAAARCAVAGAVSSVRPPWLETIRPADAAARGLARVVRVQHALEQHRQPGASTAARPRRPRSGACGSRPSNRALWPGAARRGRGGRPARLTARDAGRQPEAGAPLAVAHAVGRRVDGQHQRLVAGGLGALHQFAREAPVVLQVELEPQRAARRRRRARPRPRLPAAGWPGCSAPARRPAPRRPAPWPVRRRGGPGAGRPSAPAAPGGPGCGPSSSIARVAAGQRAQHARQQRAAGPRRAGWRAA